MKNYKKLLIITFISFFTIISTNPTSSFAGGNNSPVGTIIGAAGGAWIGSNVGKGKGNITAITLGTLVGAAFGNSIGNSLNTANSYRGVYYNITDKYINKKHHRNYHNRHDNYLGSYVPSNRYYYSESWVSPVTYTNSIMIYPTVNKNYGNVRTVYEYKVEEGEGGSAKYCREYIHNIKVAGQSEEAYGKACLMPDGSWQIQ